MRWCVWTFLFTSIAAFAQDAARSQGWIVIPVHEYAALRARAYPVSIVPESPAIEATLTRVDYELKVEGNLAQGRATLVADVIKDGWARVPIPGGLLVKDALLNGKAISLIPAPGAKPGGAMFALLSNRGRNVLTLDVAFPVTFSSGDEKLTLPSGSGMTRAKVALPRMEVEVKVEGGVLSEKNESTSGVTWLAFARGTEPLTFSWRKRSEDHRVVLPLRMRGSLTQVVALGEDATSINAEVNLEILQGAAAQARIQIPPSITVNQVSGAMIADWQTKAGELTVTFLEPVERSAGFVMIGETRLAREGKIAIPLMRLLDVERESGGVAADVLGAGEIKNVTTKGLERVDAVELGPLAASRQSPSLAAFRFRSGERELNVDLARYDQQAVLTANIEEARYSALLTPEGKTLMLARYAVRNNQRNFVKITLPAGSTVWSSSVAGRPVRPGQAPDGSLLLPLSKARAGDDAPAFPIEILYLSNGPAWNDRARGSLALPAVDLPISKTGLSFYYPPLYRVTAETGTFRTEAYHAPGSAALTRDSGATEDGSVVAPPGSLNAAQLATQALVDRYRLRGEASRGAQRLPGLMPFPAVGPSLFLVSELTAENRAPTFEFSYQREKKGGVK